MDQNLNKQQQQETESGTEAPNVPAEQKGIEGGAPPAEGGSEPEDVAELVLSDVEGEQERPGDGFKPSKKYQSMRQRAKLKKTRNENEQLREEIEQLKKQVAPAVEKPPEKAPEVPTLEGCGYDENAYQQQLTEYLLKKQESVALQTAQSQIQQSEKQRQIDGVLTSHYDRAEKLNIPDYAEREQVVRQVLTDKGTENLIAALGQGSEKVIGYLGANPDQLETFNQIANANPLEAIAYAGSLKERLNLSRKKSAVSSAPPPSDIPTGGSGSANDPRERMIKLREKDFAKYSAEKDAFIRKHGYTKAKAAGYIK